MDWKSKEIHVNSAEETNLHEMRDETDEGFQSQIEDEVQSSSASEDENDDVNREAQSPEEQKNAADESESALQRKRFSGYSLLVQGLKRSAEGSPDQEGDRSPKRARRQSGSFSRSREGDLNIAQSVNLVHKDANEHEKATPDDAPTKENSPASAAAPAATEPESVSAASRAQNELIELLSSAASQEDDGYSPHLEDHEEAAANGASNANSTEPDARATRDAITQLGQEEAAQELGSRSSSPYSPRDVNEHDDLAPSDAQGKTRSPAPNVGESAMTVESRESMDRTVVIDEENLDSSSDDGGDYFIEHLDLVSSDPPAEAMPPSPEFNDSAIGPDATEPRDQGRVDDEESSEGRYGYFEYYSEEDQDRAQDDASLKARSAEPKASELEPAAAQRSPQHGERERVSGSVSGAEFEDVQNPPMSPVQDTSEYDEAGAQRGFQGETNNESSADHDSEVSDGEPVLDSEKDSLLLELKQVLENADHPERSSETESEYTPSSTSEESEGNVVVNAPQNEEARDESNSPDVLQGWSHRLRKPRRAYEQVEETPEPVRRQLESGEAFVPESSIHEESDDQAEDGVHEESKYDYGLLADKQLRSEDSVTVGPSQNAGLRDRYIPLMAHVNEVDIEQLRAKRKLRKEQEKQEKKEERENQVRESQLIRRFKRVASFYELQDSWKKLISLTKESTLQATRDVDKPRHAYMIKLLIEGAEHAYEGTAESQDNFFEDQISVKDLIADMSSQVLHLLAETETLKREPSPAFNAAGQNYLRIAQELAAFVFPKLLGIAMVCLITHRDGDKISLEGLTQTIDYLKLLSAIAEHIQPKNFRGPFKVRIKDWFRLHRPCLRELLDGFERALVAAEYEAWLEEHRDQFRDPVRRPHRKARSHESSSSGDDSAFESARHPPSKVSSRGWYSNEAETLVKGLREFQGKDRYSRIMRKYGDVLVGRTTSDLKAKARHIKYGYLLVMERRRIKLDEEAWAWLLSI